MQIELERLSEVIPLAGVLHDIIGISEKLCLPQMIRVVGIRTDFIEVSQE
jgi:hypothetical protein